ncbi:MAG: hypothetical protein JOZ81_26895 [Chloroflexi bacterium]|nr:hypothetical protein [Chloroflexota bacterium]
MLPRTFCVLAILSLAVPMLATAPTPALADGAWTTTELSAPHEGPGVARIGTKVLFAGGCAARCEHPRAWSPSGGVDIYDDSTQTWSTAQLSQARESVASASVGQLALFAGGAPSAETVSDAVDIYDDSTGQWSTARLSQARSRVAAATVGNQVLFVGGGTYTDSPAHQTAVDSVDIFDAGTRQWRTARLSQTPDVPPRMVTVGNTLLVVLKKALDVYDAPSGRWSTVQLPDARENAAIAVVGTRVLIIGGGTDVGGRYVASDAVDAFDVGTGSWTNSHLSQPRGLTPRVATVADKVLVVGGEINPDQPIGVVDIYDAPTDSWSAAPLSEPRTSIVAGTVGTQALLAGGSLGFRQPSATVDIYDASTDQWSTASLSQPSDSLSAVTSGDQVLFADSSSSVNSSTASVDIYDAPTDTWSTGTLSQRRWPSAVGFPTRAIFVGGYYWGFATASTVADMYDHSPAPSDAPDDGSN